MTEKFNEEKNKRAERLYELEKKLGRHNKEKELKIKKDRILLKYFLIATNMIYTLAGPVLLMLGLYLVMERHIFKKQQPIVLIIFLVTGAFTGYWTLVKQVMNIK
ncbi:MAG: AtpZ/AtpI family protein [Leptotrichiaceae bacterium]|nr:AtpZ/AtpI family protein [Leptotrichiaceae bacterium]